MTKPLTTPAEQLAQRILAGGLPMLAQYVAEVTLRLDEMAADKPEPPTALTELRTIPGATGANAEPMRMVYRLQTELSEARAKLADSWESSRLEQQDRMKMVGRLQQVDAVVEAARRYSDIAGEPIHHAPRLHALREALSALDKGGPVKTAACPKCGAGSAELMQPEPDIGLVGSVFACREHGEFAEAPRLSVKLSKPAAAEVK